MTQHENTRLERIDERLDSQELTVDKMDRNILQLLIAIKGNGEFEQAGVIQNLQTLTRKVDDMASKQAAMHTDLESLKATKVRAAKIGAWVLGGLGTAAGWVWANLDKINAYFHPIPR